jgi:sugar phosphate isomerase/epimerase
MKTKLACADFAFPLLPHDKVLKLIAMLDFKGVDIGLFEKRSHLWPSREFKNPTRSGKQLKRKLDDLGLKAADVFLQMAPDFVPYAMNHPQASRTQGCRRARSD